MLELAGTPETIHLNHLIFQKKVYLSHKEMCFLTQEGSHPEGSSLPSHWFYIHGYRFRASIAGRKMLSGGKQIGWRC